jgi:SAM-dependent methyltransferase
MSENKNHWYDGWIYDRFIAPNQDRMFYQIEKLINPDSTILDVGCGTGRFSFFMADKCASIKGIDLSKRNIDRANLLLSKNPVSNISFQHTDVKELILNGNNHFQYAVMTYVIHEVNNNERLTLLNQTSELADKIIIGDYLFPSRTGFWNLLNEAVEFGAGRDHYENYKSFMAEGGIHGLVSKSNLNVIKEIKNNPATSHLVVLSK